MNKFVSILLATISLSLLSCGSENDDIDDMDGGTNSNTLVGSWAIVEKDDFYMEGYHVTGNVCDEYYVFKNNGTYEVYAFEEEPYCALFQNGYLLTINGKQGEKYEYGQYKYDKDGWLWIDGLKVGQLKLSSNSGTFFDGDDRYTVKKISGFKKWNINKE